MEESKCEDCLRRIMGLEKELNKLCDPSEGVFVLIQDKINKRPTWTIIWSLISILLILIIGSYSYTTSIQTIQNINISKLREVDTHFIELIGTMPTKNDIKEMRDELKREIEKSIRK